MSLKVLFVAREYPPFEVGGAAIHTFNLVKNLQKIGVFCKVLSFGDPAFSNDEVTFVKPSSSVIEKCNSSASNDMRIPFDVLRITRIANNLIMNEKFDIVHVEEPYIGAFVKHKRKVTTIHDTSYGEVKSLLRYGKNISVLKRLAFYFSMGFFFELISMASSQIIIVVSKQVRKEMIEVYRASKNKLVVLRNGVEIPKLNKFSRRDAKEELGLPAKTKLIFTISQHIARKRLDVLIKAVRLLKKQNHTEYKIIIAGDGPLRPSLLEMVKNSGLQDIIELPGWITQEQKTLYYQAADIFVLTSEYEAGPITLLEAMSFGNVAVSSIIDGFPSFMHDHTDGLLFPTGDYQMLSKCLDELLSNVSLREKLSASSVCFAEKFDWRSVTENTKTLYERLCQSLC
jgi:glycosyltransferase involved in cell wall biosynthesis